MTINFKNNTIELNSTEMKNAMIYGSDTYKDLQAARRDYPTFKTVEIKAKRNNNDFSDLTRKSISAYQTCTKVIRKLLESSCEVIRKLLECA